MPDKTIESANEYYRRGDLYLAERLYREVLEDQPNNFEAYNNLGNILQDQGRTDEAISCYQKAIKLNPNFAGTYYNLGDALQDKGQLDEAIICYQKVIELDPAFSRAYNNLGVALEKKGEIDKAADYCEKAIALDPTFLEAYFNLGNALHDKGQFDKAIACYQKSLQYNPYHVGTYTNLGNVFQSRGQLDKAEACYRCAIQISPGDPAPHEALLMSMNYDSRHNAQSIFSEHLQFAKHFEEPLSHLIPDHLNQRHSDRRLRIGYVSPDFRKHAVAYFIEPVLSTHNKKQFEVFCYSNAHLKDEVAKRFRGYADHWQEIAELSDENAAELIRNDGIDILVDLAGHTARNRILLFARKPAPVQVSWIGYLATTGLSAMDYKIVARYTDPPGVTEEYYTEELMRLPDCFLCYLPDKNSPQVGELPARVSGHITFGSLNNFSKVTPAVLSSWSALLNALPDSRLILKTKSLSDGATRRYATEMFAQTGIAAERISLLPWEPSPGHMETYTRIDIGLDTFPFNGGTTTCEAMWMGVPVITLAGQANASRMGVSLLSSVGLAGLIAGTPDEYVQIAVDLASDVERLQSLRKRLRGMMAHSPLTDAKRFTLNLENCYRKMWETWCNAV